MHESVRPYRLYLAVYGEFLLEMAEVIGAEYVPSSFDRAVEEMYEADEWSARWEMRGKLGRLGVLIERGDSYSSCSLRAEEPHFQADRVLTWERYGRPLRMLHLPNPEVERFRCGVPVGGQVDPVHFRSPDPDYPAFLMLTLKDCPPAAPRRAGSYEEYLVSGRKTTQRSRLMGHDRRAISNATAHPGLPLCLASR